MPLLTGTQSLWVYSEPHFEPLLWNTEHPLKVTPYPSLCGSPADFLYLSPVRVRNSGNKMHPWQCYRCLLWPSSWIVFQVSVRPPASGWPLELNNMILGEWGGARGKKRIQEPFPQWQWAISPIRKQRQTTGINFCLLLRCSSGLCHLQSHSSWLQFLPWETAVLQHLHL